MATNEQTMAWMMDTYSMQKGYVVPEIVTGKPIAIGGSVFRHEATGAGVVMVVGRACERLGLPLARAALRRPGVRQRGRGGGGRAAPRAARRWSAVSDVYGGVYDDDGLDLAVAGGVGRGERLARGLPERRHVTNAELLELECDVLVLAAREDQVTADNAPRSARGSSPRAPTGPTSIEADAILAERGILVLPDVLTNAGGVTVSYFEWVQDLGRLFWTRDEIRAKLADKLADAFDRVWALAEERGISLRTAALVAGIQRGRAALEARGIFP